MNNLLKICKVFVEKATLHLATLFSFGDYHRNQMENRNLCSWSPLLVPHFSDREETDDLQVPE
jgi:hypothetical protein